jgi:hypothetical protein
MCREGTDFHKKSQEMVDWLVTEMADVASDPNNVWKVSINHHPAYDMHNSDLPAIVEEFHPLFKEHEYDVFINGHSHMMAYA